MIFAVGTGVLYGRLAWAGFAAWHHMFIYLAIHFTKAALGAAVFFIARGQLYDRFAGRRYAQAASYLGSILRLAAAQFLLFLLVIMRADEMFIVSTPRLLAATTLSVSLPQAFILLVFVRDTKPHGRS